VNLTLRIVLACLAVYRLSELFVLDDGPYFIFRKFRKWLGQRAAGSDMNGSEYMIAQLFECPFCIGIWLAALAVIPILLPNIVTDILLVWLAIAGAQTFLETVSRNNKGRQT